jgi:hypothetical protein
MGKMRTMAKFSSPKKRPLAEQISEVRAMIKYFEGTKSIDLTDKRALLAKLEAQQAKEKNNG